MFYPLGKTQKTLWGVVVRLRVKYSMDQVYRDSPGGGEHCSCEEIGAIVCGRARPEPPCYAGHATLVYVAVVSVSFNQAGEAWETCEDLFSHASRALLPIAITITLIIKNI